ncbi:MAG: glycoside hydrolase family 127 protein, partial [Salinivirgaceae bacterium]
GRVVKTINGEQVTKPVQLKAVPYYTWNNRGTSNMLVWMPESTEATIIKPLKSPAMDAQCEGSTGRVSGFNDGFTPSSSTDYDKSYFYWWLKNGSKEWVQYNFDQPQTLCSSSVYWLDMTHYDGDFRVPEWWNLEYQTDDGQWFPVKTSDQYGLELNTYNEVNFEPVNTRSLRLNVKLGEGVSGGIHEWNVD